MNSDHRGSVLSEDAKVLRDAFHRLASWYCPPTFGYALQVSGLDMVDGLAALSELRERGLVKEVDGG